MPHAHGPGARHLEETRCTIPVARSGLAHGEDHAGQALARRIEAEHGIRARIPDLGDVIEI